MALPPYGGDPYSDLVAALDGQQLSMQPGMQGMTPPYPPEPDPNYPIPPPPEPVELEGPDNPTRKELEFAETFVKQWLKRSADYVVKKRDLWHLLEDLYYNDRKLDQFDMSRAKSRAMNRAARDSLQNDTTTWHSRQVLAVSPYVDTYADTLHERAFAIEEFLRVKPKPMENSDNVEDSQYPTSRKLQSKILSMATEVQLKSRVAEILRDAGIFGTGIAKVPWIEDRERQVFFDPSTGEVEQRDVILRQGPSIDSITPTRFLPDPDAKNAEIQAWSGIGDRAEIPYYALKRLFGKFGPFNVNRQKFIDTYPEGGQPLQSFDYQQIKYDKDKGQLSNGPLTYLQVWEWHGRIPFETRGPTECVCTVITDLNTDDPSNGVFVRCQLRPILKTTGRRPYLVYQFAPSAGPLGIGIIEQNLDLIWLLSHCLNLFIDAVRLISIPMVKVKDQSPASNEHPEGHKADVVFPGKLWRFRQTPDEVQPFSLGGTNLQALLNLIQYLEGQLERRTSVSDATRGSEGRRKTATEFHGLLQQSQKPIAVRLNLFKEQFLDPYGRIALAYMRQNIYEAQQVYIKGPNGISQPVTLTADEIRTGAYLVEASLDIPDQAKLSKAQTIMQLMPVLEQNSIPLLQFENKRYLRGGLIEAIVRLLDIGEIATVIEDVDEQTKQSILMTLGIPSPGMMHSNSNHR